MPLTVLKLSSLILYVKLRLVEVYTVPVVRIEKFGAFVHLFNKTDALIHISELAWERTEHVEDVVKVGGTVTVKIIKIDEKGRYRCLNQGLAS